MAAGASVLIGLSAATRIGSPWQRFARLSGMYPLRAIRARIWLRRASARAVAGAGA